MDYYFLAERLMGVFWVMIQQFCFVCLKYSHDDIVTGDGRARRLAVSQAFALVFFIVFCFGRELGIKIPSELLRIGPMDYFPWTVRIAICGVMILFDALLVLYFARIVRVYRRGLSGARPTLPLDVAVAIFVLALVCGYIYLSVNASSRLGLDMSQYLWIGRFFFQISNFFYIALEIGGALLLWSFLKSLKREGCDDV